MTVQEIIAGESNNVEFKEKLPEKSIKYMKSVVAFANSKGGKILFGVEDGSCKVIGIEDENLFTTIDAITNAISDSCEPSIFPDISLQTIDGKTIIVVEILEGRQRPYYIKSLGKEEGVFIRVAGTSRPADEYMIKELLFEGNNRSYDQSICIGLEININDIQKLCNAMKEIALKNCHTEEERRGVKEITERQLLSWGIIQKNNGKYLGTNAFALLSGNDSLRTSIQCAVFKGRTKSVFLDRREYEGSIQNQVEEALDFVLRNIRMGAEIKALGRRDVYEIPMETLRELLINAVVHRSYIDHNKIQVAIYDDRLEVISPGKLPLGQTIYKMKEGYSKVRNEAIAHAFSYMKLMENWGSGIPRIIESVFQAGLQEPEFIDGETDLRIIIYRKKREELEKDVTNNVPNVTDNVPNVPNVPNNVTNIPNVTNNVPNYTINYYEENGIKVKVIKIIKDNPSVTQVKMAEWLGVTPRTIKRVLSKLQAEGIVYRKGSSRSGIWLIT